jgi:hypothetical protein
MPRVGSAYQTAPSIRKASNSFKGFYAASRWFRPSFAPVYILLHVLVHGAWCQFAYRPEYDVCRTERFLIRWVA